MRIDTSVIKFLLVGALNTLVGTATIFLLYNLGKCSYWVSSAMGYLVGGVVSFCLNKYFTFQNKERSWKQVGRFAVTAVICYLVAYSVAKPLIAYVFTGQEVKIQENAAMFVGICLYTALNYFGQRFFAFRRRE